MLSCMQFPKFFLIIIIYCSTNESNNIHATLYHYNPCCTLYIIFYATIIHECTHTDEPAEESASARRRRERGQTSFRSSLHGYIFITRQTYMQLFYHPLLDAARKLYFIVLYCIVIVGNRIDLVFTKEGVASFFCCSIENLWRHT